MRKWIDYSSKYGLGYCLSNGCYGVFFNDSTKIIMDIDGKAFDYIDRKPNQKVDDITTFQVDNFPAELQKKVTLLQHFKGYLENEESEGS